MAEIRNCAFRFKCPMDWEVLQPTDNQDERYCNECNRIVHFCHTSDDLMAAMQADLCVAIENSEPDAGPFVVGMLKSRYGGDL